MPASSPAGALPDPLPHAHVVTTTTHKTLRGPRGGMILTNDEALAKKFNSAVFPGNQGGPLMHVIAAKAVAFGEALRPEFKDYARAVVANARALAGDAARRRARHRLRRHRLPHGARRPASEGGQGPGRRAALERAGLTCNKNAIPFDPEKPAVTSGVRLGTSAGTTRGFGEAEFRAHRRADPEGDRRAWPRRGRGRRRRRSGGAGRSAGLCRPLPDLRLTSRPQFYRGARRPTHVT